MKGAVVSEVERAEVAHRYGIVDADLLALIPTEKGFAFDMMCRRLRDSQKERDQKAAKEAAMTPAQRRRHRAQEKLSANGLEDKDRSYIHSVLALCALPYRRPPEDLREWQRDYGKNSLLVTSGHLKNPATGQMDLQGIPYGPKARLLMLHLCSEAILQKTRTVELQDSFSAFIRSIGFPVTGGKKGTIAQFKEQLHRLASCHMEIGLWNGTNSAETIKTTPIKKFSVWLPTNPDQRMLWASTLTFDHDFYQSLIRHALPVDMRAVQAFRGSARKLDIIFWLGYRLRNLEKSYLLTWAKVEAQFGQGMGNKRAFRRQFAEDLKAIKDVYPQLPVECAERGLSLHPCGKDALLVPPKRRG